MLRLITVQLSSLLLCACVSMTPRERLPYPLTNDSFGERVKVVTVPLPVIASSPNEGMTGGVLSAFLLHDKNGEVSTLVAPQINYNRNFGVTSILFGAFYPSPKRHLKFNLAKATRVNEEYKVRYTDQEFLSDKWELNAFAFDYTDGSARFFGFGQAAGQQDETNYSDREFGYDVAAGYRLFDHFRLVVGDRARKVSVMRGAVSGIPFTTDRFSPASVPGVDGFGAHVQKVSAVYSTLNSDTLPWSGWQAALTLEKSWRELGSSADYQGGDLEFKGFLPLSDARYITVVHFVGGQVVGDRVPFLERKSLGGETTLRGYGRYRFVDTSYLLLNLEERIRLARWTLFHVQADWELAPFIDAGSVLPALGKARSANFLWNPGIGVRAVVRPNIVGRVDVGVGREGPAVFVGLGYPF